jgi:hypothetical protein
MEASRGSQSWKRKQTLLGHKGGSRIFGHSSQYAASLEIPRGGPKFYKPRGRALYDIADLDEFIRSGIRVSSVRASKEERNVYLPAG